MSSLSVKKYNIPKEKKIEKEKKKENAQNKMTGVTLYDIIMTL